MKLLDTRWMAINRSTPLFVAAGGGHDTVVKLLLETEKVDVN